MQAYLQGYQPVRSRGIQSVFNDDTFLYKLSRYDAGLIQNAAGIIDDLKKIEGFNIMKHAYLIIAHDKPDELMRLLSALDYSETTFMFTWIVSQPAFLLKYLKNRYAKVTCILCQGLM